MGAEGEVGLVEETQREVLLLGDPQGCLPSLFFGQEVGVECEGQK